MLTMTDFIMEQELSLAPEPKIPEKTDEELAVEIVESFMNMSAAFENAECMFECAKIAEFCKEYDIQIPESARIITEGFVGKIIDIIATVIDWIRGLIAGFCNIFTKARLRSIIAKIKTINWKDMTNGDADRLSQSLLTLSLIGGIAFVSVEFFSAMIITICNIEERENVKYDPNKCAATFQLLATTLSITTNPVNVMQMVHNANKCVSGLKNLIHASAGDIGIASLNGKTNFLLGKISEAINVLIPPDTPIETGAKSMVTDDFSDTIITILTFMIETDIPHSGAGILKALNFDKTKIEELKNKNIINDDAVLAIRKCARLLAKMYDRISACVSFIMNFDIFASGAKIDDSNKETYKANINTLKAKTNSKNIKDPLTSTDLSDADDISIIHNTKEKVNKMKRQLSL